MRKLPTEHHAPCVKIALLAIGMMGGWLVPAQAMQITGYSAEANNRFSSGYPTAPVANTSSQFVGAGFDWSGVGWSSTNATKSFGFISPHHYLVARHFGGAGTIRLFGADNQLSSHTQAVVEDTGLGIAVGELSLYDLSLGTLTAGVSSARQVTRYAVLDLNAGSATNSPTAYNGLSILIYGRGNNATSSTRVGAATIQVTTTTATDSWFRTNRTDVQLENGDSGSPVFYGWTNPNGAKELTIIGNNAAIDTTNGYNYMSFVGSSQVINHLNTLMIDDGRALRVVGNPTSTWLGGSGNTNQRHELARGGNWTGNSVPTDKYVLFTAGGTSFLNPTVNSNVNLRGLYFKASVATGDPFTFSGSSTLTIGRGGVTNYDNDRQVFTAPLALGAPQFWDAGPGGVSVGNLNTNGHLLEIRSAGPSVVNGIISGSGGVALESGQLTLAGTSNFTGSTWVHEGFLRVTGNIASSAGVLIAQPGTLEGSGRVSSISGAGTVSPGPGAAILRAASIQPAGGLDFDFSFSSELPVFGQAGSSGNDVLRVDATGPVTQALGAANTVRVFLNRASLQPGDSFRGGFFCAGAEDFLPLVADATWEVYFADAGGEFVHDALNYRRYTGPLPITVSSETQTAAFAGGSVDGRILALHVGTMSYAGWAEDIFPEEIDPGLKAPESDTNGDGVTNLMVYALALDPVTSAHSSLPSAFVEMVEGTREFVFRFRRNRQAGDLQYVVEISDTLTGWSDFVADPVVVEADVDGDGLAELVEVRVPLAEGTDRLFGRLRVRLSQP